MVIEAFDKSLYATVEDSMFALEEIPKVQLKSQNFDEILPTDLRLSKEVIKHTCILR